MYEYLTYNVQPWGWEIPLYFFLIGTAAMSFALAAAPAVLGGAARVLEPFQKLGMFLALALLVVCGPLLIVDLGQPGRFLYPIIYFHWTSPLSWGSLFLPLFGLAIVGFLYALYTGRDQWLRPIGIIGGLLALSMPLYTGLDLMVNQARELWSNPTIPMLFVILSVSSGTALAAVALLLTGALDERLTATLRGILYASVGATLALFLAFWVVFMYGSEEIQHAWALINSQYGFRFWGLTLVLGIILPLALLAAPRLGRDSRAVALAGVLAAVGAYTFREVIIHAGQLPMAYY